MVDPDPDPLAPELLWFALRCQIDAVAYRDVGRARAFVNHDVALNVLRNAARCAADQMLVDREAAEEVRLGKSGRARCLREAAYQQLFVEGWSGVSVSQEIGGQGLPMVLQCALHEAFFLSVKELWFSIQVSMIGLALIDCFGTEALKSNVIPRLLSGEWMVELEHGLVDGPNAPPSVSFPSASPGGRSSCCHGNERGGHNAVRSVPYKLIQVVVADGHRGCRDNQEEKAIFLLAESPLVPGGCDAAVHAEGMSFPLRFDADQPVGECVSGTFSAESGMTACRLTSLREAAPLLTHLGHAMRLLLLLKAATGRSPAEAPVVAQWSPGAADGSGGLTESMTVSVAKKAMGIDALRAIAYAYAAAIDIASMHPDAGMRREHAQFLGLLSPLVDGWLLALDVGDDEGLLCLTSMGLGHAHGDAAQWPPFELRLKQVASELLKDRLVADGGKAFRAWLQGVFDDTMVLGSGLGHHLGEIRQALLKAIELLQHAVAWSLANFSDRSLDVWARSGCLLALFAAVLGASQMARLAMVADRELSCETCTDEAHRSGLQAVMVSARNFASEDLIQVVARAQLAFDPA